MRIQQVALQPRRWPADEAIGSDDPHFAIWNELTLQDRGHAGILVLALTRGELPDLATSPEPSRSGIGV
jgi:hypothetical protein